MREKDGLLIDENGIHGRQRLDVVGNETEEGEAGRYREGAGDG